MTLSPRDKTLTLVGILLAVFLGALDQTIVSTALPRIAEDLRGLSRYAWVATAYLLASTVLVPVYGKLADMVSRKRLMTIAVATFLLGSLLCGVSGEFGAWPLVGDGMNQLIVFRALQGVGGAGLFSLAFIVIADLFPARERGRYQGLVGATFGVASVLGPWVGGLLTDHAGGWIPGVEGWRWVFYVNVPFGALALWFLWRRMPPLEPAGERTPLDVLSAVLLIAGLSPVVLGLQLDHTAFPWSGPTVVTLLIGGGLALVAFVWRSIGARNPILDMRMFRDRVFALSNLALVFLGGTFLSIVIFLPLFMVNVVGVSATQAGVSIIPLSLGAVVGSVVSGQLVASLGRYRPLMLIGAMVLAIALVLLATMPLDVTYGRVTLYMVLAGLGVGPSLPLYTLAIQNAVPPHKLGQATSASQFFRQVGGTVAAAVMGSLLAATLAGAFESGAQVAGSAASGPIGSEAAISAERLRSTGSAGIEASIRTQVEASFAPLLAAAREGDPAAFARALEGVPLSGEARSALAASAPSVADAGPGAWRALAETIEARVHDEAARATDAVAVLVRGAFHEAITKIFRWLIAFVAVGFVATVFVPALELARAPDPAPAAAD